MTASTGVGRGKKSRDPTPKHVEDPELGLLRWCSLCQEYWPADLEFFYQNGAKGLHTYCKACAGDWKRIHEPGRNGSKIGAATR